jgi:hypothetical protein
VMSVKILKQIPYTIFGSFLWTLGYFKGVRGSTKHKERR